MTPTICCAYLRVYEPLDTFSQPARDRIVQAIADPVSTKTGPHALGLLAAEERREVFTREVDGVHLVCPAQTKLRTMLGMIAFERALPRGASGVFFDAGQVESAQREVERLKAAAPIRPYIVQSPWHVPVRWFVCFGDTDRILVGDGDHPCVRYEARVSDARERTEHALRIISGGIDHPGIVWMVRDLSEWLARFDDRALVELDYASVATLFTADELADDHSAADIGNAIEALAAGDGARAQQHYAQVSARWASSRARENLN